MCDPTGRFRFVDKKIDEILWSCSMETFVNVHANFEFDALPYGQPMKSIYQWNRTVAFTCVEDEFSGFVL